MKGFVDNIEKLTEENNDFRRVVYTGHNLQLVLMAIQPGDEIGGGGVDRGGSGSVERQDDRAQGRRAEEHAVGRPPRSSVPWWLRPGRPRTSRRAPGWLTAGGGHPRRDQNSLVVEAERSPVRRP